MFSVKKSYSIPLHEAEKAWPFDKTCITKECLTAAPEFLTLIISESDEPCLFSRTLKQYFEQERIMKQLGQSIDFDTISVRQKLESSSREKEVEVFKDKSGIALLSYSGMFPTRSYEHSREVFFITGEFYSYLANKYPHVDVNEKLKEAHQYFCQFEAARRHHGSLRSYLEGWVSGDLIKLNRMRKKKVQISKNNFYEDFLRD